MEFRPHHTAISVQDMDSSIAFYEIFGFEVTKRFTQPESEIAHLALGGHILEIFWYRQRRDPPASAAQLSTDLPRVGVKHLALHVDDIEQAKAFAESRGLGEDVAITTGHTGIRYFFLNDPSGNLFEILQVPADE